MFIARIIESCAVWLALLAANQAATPTKPHFLDHATIEQKGGNVAVLANDPRPLDQALKAIREQYGWLVDYEDPPYGPHDLVDDTDPRWRAEHPDAKGVTRVAGGIFTTDFQSGGDSPPDQERVLNQVVTDYAKSGNPGVFILKKESANRYAVVGVGTRDGNGNTTQGSSILDNQIVLPLQERTVGDALQLILGAVSATSGYKVVLGSAPTNLILQTNVKLGGGQRSARELLAELATTTRFPMVWRLLYDADVGWYFMNLEIGEERSGDGDQLKPILKH